MNYRIARPYSAKLSDMIDDGIVDTERLAIDLMNYMSEDDVHDFMVSNGYIDDDNDDDDEE